MSIFCYNETPVLENIGFIIKYGDRFSVSGNNGSGKTTLLRLIAGELHPTGGSLKVFTRPIYLDQRLELLNPQITVLDNFHIMNPTADDNFAYDMLARFLFRSKDAEKRVSELSGGEMLKATLACVLGMADLELLILDEPTNNLDIESLEIMEQSLNLYRGALVVVSHDQYFLNNINITEIINL